MHWELMNKEVMLHDPEEDQNKDDTEDGYESEDEE